MIKFLQLPDDWEDYKVASGSTCYVLAGGKIETFLFDKFRRTGLCIKVYEHPGKSDIEKLDLSSIITEARIQNIFALFGIAPIVYRLVILSNRRIGLVVEYATNEGEPDIYLVGDLIRKFRLQSSNPISVDDDTKKFDFITGLNWVGDKLIDFGGWHFEQD